MTSGIGADDSLPANLYKVKSRFGDEENVVFCPVAKQSPFWTAQCTLAGIEVMHMIKKGQLVHDGEQARTPADQFYALAA
jgi:hypothetical protein